MQKQGSLFVWGLIGAVLLWGEAFYRFETHPIAAGFWAAIGFVFLVTGVIMGIIGWAVFWTRMAEQWWLSLGIVAICLALIKFGPEFLNGAFFTGFWYLAVAPLAILAMMSGVAFVAGAWDRFFPSKGEQSDVSLH